MKRPRQAPGTRADLRPASVILAGLGAACAGVVSLACVPQLELMPRAGPAEVRIRPGEEVVLDGSGSFDPEGERLSFRWRQSAGPTVELRDADTPWPRFVPPAPGRYEFELVVAAAPPGGGAELASPPARLVVEVLPPNRPPEIRLERELSAEPGQWVFLDGGGASDPDGDALTFRWELVEAASRELVEMEPFDGRARCVRVRAWRAGSYSFRLVVRDSYGAESSALVRLVVAPRDLPPVSIPRMQGRAWVPVRLAAWPHPGGGANLPPIARASATFLEGGEVLLDGSGSSDPNGDELEHRWAQVSGPPVRVLRPIAGRPADRTGRPDLSRVAFLPPAGGRYCFRLTVSDGFLESAPDEVEFSVPGAQAVERPRAPAGPALRLRDTSLAADAGPDIVTELGSEVALDGSRSRGPDRARMLFDWRQVSGPQVLDFRMEDPQGRLGRRSRQAAPIWRFTPRESGRYVFALSVSTDGETWSAPDQVAVTVLAPNRPPEIRTCERLRCRPRERILLSAAVSDPDGDEVACSWRVVSGRAAALESHDGTAAVEAASPGELVLEVLARDSRGSESRRRVRLEVVDSRGTPVASARVLGRRGRVILDATDSYDPEGAPLEYHWDVSGATLVRLLGRDSPRASFSPPAPGRYEFTLAASARGRSSRPVRVPVDVETPAASGISIRGARPRVTVGTPVVLDASGSRESNGRTPVVWRAVSGGPLQLPEEPRERIAFVPREPGLYVLRAESPHGGPAGAEVRFAVVERNAAPVARANVRTSGTGRVVLDGSRSKDPDGDPLRFAWVQTSGEPLGLERCGELARRAGRLVLDRVRPGRYGVRLVVTDGERVARSDEIEFDVPGPPSSGTDPREGA